MYIYISKLPGLPAVSAADCCSAHCTCFIWFLSEHVPLSLVWCAPAMKATVYCDKVLAFSGLLCNYMMHEQAKLLLATTLIDIIDI